MARNRFGDQTIAPLNSRRAIGFVKSDRSRSRMQAMLASECATLTLSDSEGNQRARPSSERPLSAKAA
jgi:hypothetical protein